jgi:release factor glutamine methyltransferase
MTAEIAEILRSAGIVDADHEAASIWAAACRDYPDDSSANAKSMAERRIAGTPLAYITRRQIFMGVELITDEGALIPREETELLGGTALTILGTLQHEPRVIDMCCGSGNLACAIAHRRPQARVWATDLTDGCVSLTRRNVLHLGLSDRVTVVQGDLFANLRGLDLEGTIDVIVCNPPYISQSKLDTASTELLKHEPREAFDGGPYGLTIHQRVIKEAFTFLRPSGSLLFEIGLGQDRQLGMLFAREKAYEQVQFVPNAAGDLRVCCARKPI